MLPKIICSGTPWTLGEEYGLQCKELIRGFLAEMEEYLANHLNLEPNLLAQRCTEYFLPFIQKKAPHLWTEIQGLAEASKQPVEKILLIQGISELLYGIYPDGLIASAVNPSTNSGQVIAGMNIDFPGSFIKKYLVVREIQPAQGRARFLMLSFAGSLGSLGINDRKIGFFSLGLESSGIQKGLPVSLISRLTLEQGGLAESIKLLNELPRVTARNFFLMDETTCVELESTISRQIALWPTIDGVSAHGNHFIADEFKELDLGAGKWPGSAERRQRSLTLLQKHAPISDFDLQRILADHINYPKGICRHAVTEDNPVETIASVIVSSDKAGLYICTGSPCSNEYEFYPFQE